jgi:PAS domain S-box-containing protein
MFSFKIVLGILFGLMVLTIAVLGIISYQKGEAFIRTSAMVNQTREILDHAEIISSHYKEIQLESDAFYIIHDSRALEPYRIAKQSIFSELEDLRALTAQNQSEQLLIDSLDYLLTGLVQSADSAFLGSTKTAARRIEISRNFRRQIQTILNTIRREERAMLSARQAEYKASVTAFQNTFFLLLFVIYSLLLATFFSIRHNFNKRIRAEEKLTRANDLSSKLFHETPVGIVISQQNSGVIMDCNRAFERLVDYSRDEIVGRTAASLRILESPEKRNEIINNALRDGLPGDIEVQLKPKNRDPIWTSVSMQSFPIDNTECLLLVVRDMTVYKQAESEIKKALNTEKELNRMKSNFVTLASHEFRTPLTTILSSSFLIENYASGETADKIHKHLDRIKTSVNLLTSILDEFLSLSKIEEGTLKPHLEEMDLAKQLEAICLNLQAFSKSGQKLVYKHSGPARAYSDKVLLASIITNLISNAIKYSPENSTISVSSSVNQHIHISVKDAGIGIPKADQKHLFKRFYRASNAGNIQGTGLGLHILKHYVDMLGGSIVVESGAGQGSEFRVTLKQDEIT